MSPIGAGTDMPGGDGDVNDPQRTLARIQCCSNRTRFRPYQSPHLNRYDAILLEGAGMRRREFLGVLGGAAVVWPVVARAQQAARPVIGYLGSTSHAVSESQLAGFHQGLSEASLVEGKNLVIEYRWSDGQYDRLPAMAAELASRQVTAILASGLPAALAAKSARSGIVLNGTNPTLLTSKPTSDGFA
jgi:hypothetical protein